MKPYNNIAAEDYYEMALEWVWMKNGEKARGCLRKCIELNPHFVYAYVTLSEVLAGDGEFGEAAQVLKKASRFDPEFGRLSFLQAKYRFKAGDYPAALKAIDHAMEIAPGKLYRKSREVILKALRSDRRKREKS